jgi:2'-deoxynucleoside 5'-phosphate N-hydrolase
MPGRKTASSRIKMNKQAYIAVSFEHYQAMQPVLNGIKAALEWQGIRPFVFCEHYTFTAAQEQEMMRQAFAAIDACSLLIAETTHKAIGIGVEAGFARGKNIPAIYVRRRDAPHSTTVAGASQYQVIYDDAADLERQLTEALVQIVHLK